MAFDFDKLRKTVTGAGQQALAKTKEIADTSRLNSMISEEEKLIDSHYYQIGKLYASLHRNDSEEEFSSMIAAITESEIKIRDYKSRFKILRVYNAVRSVVRRFPKEPHSAALVERLCLNLRKPYRMILYDAKIAELW